jgi:hypothetical protein
MKTVPAFQKQNAGIRIQVTGIKRNKKKELRKKDLIR